MASSPASQAAWWAWVQEQAAAAETARQAQDRAAAEAQRQQRQQRQKEAQLRQVFCASGVMVAVGVVDLTVSTILARSLRGSLIETILSFVLSVALLAAAVMIYSGWLLAFPWLQRWWRRRDDASWARTVGRAVAEATAEIPVRRVLISSLIVGLLAGVAAEAWGAVPVWGIFAAAAQWAIRLGLRDRRREQRP